MPGVEMGDTLVLGLGNIMRSDDGVGVRAIELLQKLKLPAGVKVLLQKDGGTGAPDLLQVLAGHERAIIVDAVRGDGEPGTIYCITPDDVETEPRRATSLHQIGLTEMLAMAKQLGCCPGSIVIFGVEPRSVDWGQELSPEVSAAIPRVVELVLEEFIRLRLSP